MSDKVTIGPAIRFKGFTDPWEQCKLKNLAEDTYGGGTPKTSVPKFWDGDVSWIQSSDLTEHQFSNVKAKKYITKEAIKKSATKIVPSRSIAIVTRVGVGKLAFMHYEYTTSQDFLSLSKLKLDEWFTVYLIYKKLQSELNAVQGTSIKGITKEELLNKKVSITTSKEEQIKIGALLHNIDDLITLQQRELDLMKKEKQTLLSKMFPKTGEQFPEIRFKGFTNPWEQCKVSDILEITRGYVLSTTLTKTNQSDEMPYPVYSSQTKDSGLMGFYKDYLYEDAITWTTDGANAGTVKYREGKFYCTNVCGVLLSKNIKASQMISEVLNKVAKGYVSYVGNPKLMNNVMANIKIQIPVSQKEQEKISLFFKQLDTAIALQQRKLDQMKIMKKSLLKAMFV